MGNYYCPDVVSKLIAAESKKIVLFSERDARSLSPWSRFGKRHPGEYSATATRTDRKRKPIYGCESQYPKGTDNPASHHSVTQPRQGLEDCELKFEPAYGPQTQFCFAT